jgi:hypothetical protein
MNHNHHNDNDDDHHHDDSTSYRSHHYCVTHNQAWYDPYHQQMTLYTGDWDEIQQQPSEDGYGTAIYDCNNNIPTHSNDKARTATTPQIASYQGYFRKGLFHGPQSNVMYTNGDVYQGDCVAGQRHGANGTYLWYQPNRHSKDTTSTTSVTNHTYRGAWQTNQRHGYGIMTFVHCKEEEDAATTTTNTTTSMNTKYDYYEGEFQNGQRHGYGRFHWSSSASGASYDGQWQWGKYHGTGTYTDPIHRTITVGTFHQGLQHGYGKVYAYNNSTSNSSNMHLLEEGYWEHGTKLQEKPPSPLMDATSTILPAVGCSTGQRPPEHHDDTTNATMTQLYFETQCTIHPRTPGKTETPRPPPPSYPPPPPPPPLSSPSSLWDTTTSSSGNGHSESYGDGTAIVNTNANATDPTTYDMTAVVDQRVTDIDGYSGIYTGIVLKNHNHQPHGVGKIRYDTLPNTTSTTNTGSTTDTNNERYCIYEGFWRYGSKHGYGRNLFLPEQDLYIGEYRYNVRNGYGQYVWKDGRTYDGQYVNDVKHGHGIFRYPNGASYVGYVLGRIRFVVVFVWHVCVGWVNTECTSHTITSHLYYHAFLLLAALEQLQMISMFENGQRHGYGRHEFIEDKIDRDGKTMGYYEGEFRHNQYHGKGTIVYDSIGHTYHGEFQNGMKHGYGTETHTATNVMLRQGQWIRGNFVALSVNKVEVDDTLVKEEKVEDDATTTT